MLLERDREVELLAGLLAGANSSEGKVVLVRGEAGVGKTSLIKEFVERHGDKAHVLWGSCDDLMTPQPLGPFWEIARTESAVDQALVEEDRGALFQSLLDLLARSLRPTVLVLDDTQWAGEATLDAITYLGRRIGSSNGLLVLIYRDEGTDRDHPLRTVIGSLAPQDVARIRLECLTADAVKTMLDGESVGLESIMRLTDGNPLFVTEIVASGRDHIPLSVRDSVLGRAARLSPQAGEMLKVLSVITQKISFGELRRFAGADAEVQECVHRGLLVAADDEVWFRHELIRRVVEESLTSEVREAANRAALKILSDEADPARLVHHAKAAGDVGRLIELAPRAAEAAAAVGSHREAIAHYRTLEPYFDRLESDAKGQILDSWGSEQQLVADHDEAIRIQQLRVFHHRDQGDHRAESAALVAEAFAHFRALSPAEAERLTDQAIELLGSGAAGPDLVPVFEFNAYMAMMSLDFAGTREWVERALEAAGPDTDESLIIRCLSHRGTADALDRYPAGKADLDEAVRRAEAIGNWAEVSRALHNHAGAAVAGLDLASALDYAQRSVATATREDVPGRLAYAKLLHADLVEFSGGWDEAERVARDAQASVLNQAVALPIVGAIEARKGKPGARTTLTKAWKAANEVGRYQDLAPAAAALAEYAWISGDTDIPIDDIKEVMRTGLSIAPRWDSTGSIVRWLWELSELAEIPESIAEPYRLIIDGEPLEAAELWAEIGAPYEEAIALSHGDSPAQLEALEKLETLGATAVAAKIRQRLTDQGVAVPGRKAQATRQHGAGLTARQAEVLELLAEGLSNLEISDRLFVSLRTAEHHVSAVLSKLDVTTRQDAVTQARAQGLLTTV